MNIKTMILTPNSFSRPCKKLLSVKGIVIHWIGNAMTSALMNRNYFEGLKKQRASTNSRYASAHFIVGLEGEIIQCLPIDEWAYHVGSRQYTDIALRNLSSYPNNCTLGIEMCHPDWSGKFNSETLESAIKLTATLLKQFNLTPYDVYRHYDITWKNCPRYFVENDSAFFDFRKEVERYLIKIK
ncbi:MAG: peptidoglycan recognition family protein [Treponemataceae bacterium]